MVSSIAPNVEHPIVQVSTSLASEVAVISIWFRIGARYDRPGYEGFSHLFEHTLLCLKTKEEQPLKNYLASSTDEFSLKTSVDFVNLKLICRAFDAQSIFETICWTLSNAIIDSSIFENEKSIVINEITCNSFISGQLYINLIREYLWSGPVTNSILGNVASVQRITPEMVSELIQKIWSLRKFFVLYTGSVDIDIMEKVLSKYSKPVLGYSCATKESPVELDSRPSASLHQALDKCYCDSIDIQNTTIAYLPVSDSRRIDSIALSIMSRCVAFGNMGYIAKHLREDSLSLYYIMAMPVNFIYEQAFLINFITSRDHVDEARSYVQNAISVLFDELKKNSHLLEEAKRSLANEVRKAHMTPFRSLDYIGQSLICNDTVERYNETLEGIRRMDISTMERSASGLGFDRRPSVVVLDGKKVRYA